MMQTPWETKGVPSTATSGTGYWTTLAEEATFLTNLAAANPRIALDTIGTSAGGRTIRLVRIGANSPPQRRSWPSILITGNPHGDELAPREAALAFIRDMAETTDSTTLDYLSAHPLFVVPTNNPDGTNSFTRENSAGVDLNRDYVSLSQPESRALALLLRDIGPDVHVDMHEADLTANQDVMLLEPTNPNVDSGLRSACVDLLAYIKGRWTADGYTHEPYDGGTEPSIGRNMSGLRHTLGLLFESKNRNGQTLLRRVATHRAGLGYVIDYHRTNAAAIASVRDGARLRKEAEAVAQSRAFDVDGTIIGPPPTGYRLTASQQTTAASRLETFGVMIENGVVWMHQSAQPIIPYLLDTASAAEVVPATRIFDTPYARRYEWWDGARWRECSTFLPDGSAYFPDSI